MLSDMPMVPAWRQLSCEMDRPAMTLCFHVFPTMTLDQLRKSANRVKGRAKTNPMIITCTNAKLGDTDRSADFKVDTGTK